MSGRGFKISGFTLVRNGVQFDYPFMESLRSLLPLVDELWINVGVGDDDTLVRVREIAKIDSKIKFFESVWPLNDPEKKRGGLILSEQTNLALDRCTGDWCIYLQADEVLHEADREQLLASMSRAHERPEIEGLVFDYVHFYGSYGVIQQSRSAYRREVRAIRRKSGARSVGDAQSFRKPDGSKLKAVRAGARVFHYGWVRTPDAMKEKTFFMDQLYHGDPKAEAARTGTPHTGDNYRYKRIWGLREFAGTHPETMRERISAKGWNWDLKNSPMVWGRSDLKKIVLDSWEYLTGQRLFEYRSYRLISGRGVSR